MIHNKILIPPPADYESFSPSELFRFFFQVGHWTEGSFSDEFQAYTRGTLISTVTINKWKNKDVIPTRYSGHLFKLIESLSEPDIAEKWIAAFETVWALHSAGKSSAKEFPNTTQFSDKICAQHRKWIQHIFTQPMDGETFSAADIYVPLQFSRNTTDKIEIIDANDILAASAKPWTFISGGPGSGKSMSAQHLAASLCEGDVFPIYIRGKHLSDIDIDITNTHQLIIDSFSIKSFLKHFRASSFNNACLVLDGLDEINQTAQGGSNRLSHLLSNLKIEQSACDAHHKTLNIIVQGRETHIDFAARHVPANQSCRFNLLALDGSPQERDDHTHQMQGVDLRPIWWTKYLAVTQKETDSSLPDFLCLEYDDFYSFGTNPLLSYLICQTAFTQTRDNDLSLLPHEVVNAFTYRSNKNEIYKSIIQHLSLKIDIRLTPHKFLSVLQHMALVIWQSGDQQSAPINKIYQTLEQPDVKQAFHWLGLGQGTSPTADIFITSFYYRITSPDTQSEDMTVEFTHDTFLEYLLSTLLFDRFEALISAFQTKEHIEEALKSWAAVSHCGAHTAGLAGFCQKEAALRFDSLSGLDWDIALNIIQEDHTTPHFNAQNLEALSQIQHSNSLLFFIWSCLNLERKKQNHTHFSLTDNAYNFNLDNFRKLVPPNTLRYHTGTLIEPSQAVLSFLSFSLSGLHLSYTDMCQLSFSQGHMEHTLYTNISFAMTYWSHVKISDTEFNQTTFQQAIFHHWHVSESEFKNCLFQGAHFQGALFKTCLMQDVFFSQCHFSDVEFMAPNFESVIFDRCVFSEASFSQVKETLGLKGAKFRHCTFLGMATAMQDIPKENLISTIQHNMTGIRPISSQSFKMKTDSRKIL